MNEPLRQALLTVGWDTLYEHWIPNLRPPSPSGERVGNSPWPDVTDRNPSFSVNTQSGLFYCFQTRRGGSYVQFCAWMTARPNIHGELVPDYAGAERSLAATFGVDLNARALTEATVEAWSAALAADLTTWHQIESLKPWSREAVATYGIGYDVNTNRIIFPLQDQDGHLVNSRGYQPGGRPKFTWVVAGANQHVPWPYQAWTDPWLILVEGEPDALTLRSMGFPGVTGVGGAGDPVPPGHWPYHKRVYVLMDVDGPGREASAIACERLSANGTVEVFLCQLPDWEGRPAKADISDLVMHLGGYASEAAITAVEEIILNASRVAGPSDGTAIARSFHQAFSAERLGERVSVRARVSAQFEHVYALPNEYEITCPADGHSYCERCPMRRQHRGRALLLHQPQSIASLRLIATPEGARTAALKLQVGIPAQCTDPQIRVITATNVRPVVLTPPLEAHDADGRANPDGGAEWRRQEAYVVHTDDAMIEPGRDYELTGLIYPHPRDASLVMLADQLTPVAASLSETPDAETLVRLQVFQPALGQDPIDKLSDVADDLADAVTMIVGRSDLHLAYQTVWHSALSFYLGEALIERGWLEALVLGDTRCGKSVAFRRLASYYGVGYMIDCKMQSIAGILGAVMTSPTTSERYVMPGILPQQDGRVVCFDEFHSGHHSGGRGDLIEQLSSTRSEGVVRISKAASAQFRARVRSVWLANPDDQRLLSDTGLLGCELMRRLIRKPEDLARFDLALVVAQQDVPQEQLHQIIEPKAPRYDPELSRALLRWTYSRRPDQIRFTPEALEAVSALSQELCHTYDASIPLVEPSDQRTRVARVAVSVAAQLFSTPDGERLEVQAGHVHAAQRLFNLWYRKPAMGYDLYSTQRQKARELHDEAAIRRIFEDQVHPHGRSLAERLLGLDEFTERTFGTLVPGQGFQSRAIIQTLHNGRCIALADYGRREAFSLTPTFVRWLQKYLNETAPTNSQTIFQDSSSG